MYGLYAHLSLRGATRAVILEQSEESRAATRQSQKISVSYEIATLTLAMTKKWGRVAENGVFWVVLGLNGAKSSNLG